jgi:hypothetical protein
MKTKDRGKMPRRIKLYEHRGKTCTCIDAEIKQNGDLQLSGQDVGEAPKKFWGDSDYEYCLAVQREYKDQVLLVLIEKLYGGNPSAINELRELLESNGIPCEFNSWV